MTTWVLLRGLTREARHWGRFVDVFEAEFPRARVIAIDLPGNGVLNGIPSPTDVPAMTSHVRESLALLDVEGPVAVIAMSLGAMVAIDWAATQPHELSAAVLVNTSLRGLSPLTQRLRPMNPAWLLQLVAGLGTGHAHEALVLRLTSHLSGAQADGVVGDWAALRRERPVSRVNALRQLIAAARFTVPAQRPAVPLLVLGSAQDELVDPRCSQALAAHWQLPIATHPWAGHDLPLDDPAWVARTIRHAGFMPGA